MGDLTDDEIARVREMLKVSDEITEHAEYRIARRMVVKSWRGLIMGLAGVIGAAYILRDAIKGALE